MNKIVMKDGENDFVGGMVFYKRVKRLLEDMTPGDSIELNLSSLYLDSSMIGTLLAIHTSCMKKGIKMVIDNVSEETIKVLEITGVKNLLKFKEAASEDKQ